MKAIRIPKGVKLGGKGVGGRFVSLQDVPGLAAALTRGDRTKLERRLGKETRKATKALERAAASEERASERGRGFTRARGIRKRAQEKARALRAIQDATRSATRAKKEAEAEAAADRGTAAVEWAVGASYEPGSGRRGARTSAVDVSILIRRIDGRAMKQSEARRVLTYVREHRIVPTDYYLAGIDWRSPNAGKDKAKKFLPEGQWRTGNLEGDFDAFYNVLTAISGAPGKWTVKMGGLK